MRVFLYRQVYWPIKNGLEHGRRKRRLAARKFCRSRRAETLSVILLSYKRPGNIDKILSSVALCEFVEEIIISNNNPDVRIEKYLSINDPRMRVINQPERRYASVRYELSLEAKSEFILAIDDDLFLDPEQILKLFEILVEDPFVPHGAGGQVYSEDFTRSQQISHTERPVEALVWLFAYTRAHVLKYFELLNAMGLDNRRLDSSEDVPLSFAGESHARVHDLGSLSHCPTGDQPGIATWKNPGFREQRIELVRRMRDLRKFDRQSLGV